jgi:DNA-binding HxlR family transcriptional regulator
MRSYGQYCALAKALDVIGDRWSLLIVRELALRDACRYTDLREGLPGIATNLLADRLRELEAAGIVEREDAPPPVATTLFRLTDRGRELRPAMHALGRWGAPLLGDDFGEDSFRSHWLRLPLELNLDDRIPQDVRVSIGVHAGSEDTFVEIADGRIHTRDWTTEVPDVVLTGRPKPILGFLTGLVDLDRARSLGVEFEGDVDALRRLFEEQEPAAATARG